MKRQEQLKKLLEIRIKKKDIFNLCEQVDGDIRKQLIEIAKNEKKVDQERIKQIAKKTQITQSNIKNWIDYYKYNLEYVSEIIELNRINDEIFKITERYRYINSNYVLEAPVIISDKKVKLQDEEESTELSTKSQKRIRMKK